MTEPLDSFAQSLTVFRPLGELRYVERVLFELGARARDDVPTLLWVKANVPAALRHLGVPESVIPRVTVHLTPPDERHLVIPTAVDMEASDDPFAHASLRAAQDLAFRTRLVANPRTALGEVLGQAVDSDLKLHVHQNSCDELHLVLLADVCLSDELLEQVAGGLGAPPPPPDWCPRPTL